MDNRGIQTTNKRVNYDALKLAPIMRALAIIGNLPGWTS